MKNMKLRHTSLKIQKKKRNCFVCELKTRKKYRFGRRAWITHLAD